MNKKDFDAILLFFAATLPFWATAAALSIAILFNILSAMFS